MDTIAPGARPVVLLVTDTDNDPLGHDHRTREALARRIATLRGGAYAGEFAASADYGMRPYFVPDCTLLRSRAEAFGIRGEDDLFGGVVPHAFLANKTISHPLVDAGATAPPGWTPGLARRLAGAVLPGYAAFSLEDARLAGRRLLAHGRIRVKSARGVGGDRQVVAADAEMLEAALRALGEPEIRRHGVVVERDLADPVTYSVGRFRMGGTGYAYHGTQMLVADRDGDIVYGGSELTVVRGGFEALENLDMPPAACAAIRLARQYDAAVSAEHPGFFASRRNYDVAAGRDSEGVDRIGVLEQSWRIGGATAAELAGVDALAADPALAWVAVSTHEAHLPQEPPPGAHVHFRDPQPAHGPLLKYSKVLGHGYPA